MVKTTKRVLGDPTVFPAPSSPPGIPCDLPLSNLHHTVISIPLDVLHLSPLYPATSENQSRTALSRLSKWRSLASEDGVFWSLTDFVSNMEIILWIFEAGMCPLTSSHTLTGPKNPFALSDGNLYCTNYQGDMPWSFSNFLRHAANWGQFIHILGGMIFFSLGLRLEEHACWLSW
jgi:hypothetical protein